MGKIYIDGVQINKVRHLHDIEISINSFKHLIFTGKNGSGKTSVLEALRDFLNRKKSDTFCQITLVC